MRGGEDVKASAGDVSADYALTVRNITCSYCGATGHTSNNCPVKAADQKAATQASGGGSTSSGGGRPVGELLHQRWLHPQTRHRRLTLGRATVVVAPVEFFTRKLISQEKSSPAAGMATVPETSPIGKSE